MSEITAAMFVALTMSAGVLGFFVAVLIGRSLGRFASILMNLFGDLFR